MAELVDTIVAGFEAFRRDERVGDLPEFLVVFGVQNSIREFTKCHMVRSVVTMSEHVGFADESDSRDKMFGP